MIQYPDAIADAAGTVAEPYNIFGSNDQFSVSIDGGSNQVITLTHGSTRTAAQVVADLSGLTGALAYVANINGQRVVRVRTTSSNGTSSSILFNTPSNNSNALLGFVATTYTGGISGSYIFIGDTKQALINGLEQGLLNAGWITVSGHNTTNLLMQSSMTPMNQNLRMRVRIKDNSGSCVEVSIENVWGTIVGTNNTSLGAALFPKSGRSFKMFATKHQAFVRVPGQNAGLDYAGWGTPWIPQWMEGLTWESMWIQSNSNGEGTWVTGGFRNSYSGGSGNYNATASNGLYWEDVFNAGGNDQGRTALWSLRGYSTSTISYRWFDLAAVLSDPLITWGTTSRNDEGFIRGQLWSAFLSSDIYPMDDTLTGVDGHTWSALQTGTVSPQLFLLAS